MAVLRGAEADVNRPGYIVEDKIGKRHILKARSGAAVELDRTSIDLIQQAIGDGDVLGYAAAKAK